MTARAPERTADVTPAYGMRPVGGWGLRGWRAHCPACGFLSRLYTHIRNAEYGARTHRCEASQ